MSTLNNVIGFAAALQALQARRNEYAGRAVSGYAGLGAATYVEKVKQAQIALTFVGFPTGGADGYWGPNTERAARAFAVTQNVEQPPDGTQGYAAFLTPAFDAALSRRLAQVKGQQQPQMITAPQQTGGGTTSQPVLPPPGTTADLPPLEAAKQWLLAPGAPVYKKPILYIGVGVVALTLVLAMRARE